MEKILQYLRFGKGFGLLFVLAASILISMVVLIRAKVIYNKEVYPRVALVVEDFLPITIEKGKIVSPQDTYKKINLGLAEGRDMEFSVVLDTREETVNIPEESGLYIYRDMVYVVSDKKIDKFAYTKDGVFDKVSFYKLLDTMIAYLSMMVALLLVVLEFLWLSLNAMVIAFLSCLAARFIKLQSLTNMGAFMRVSSVVVSFVSLLIWGLDLPLGGSHAFFFSLILVMFFLYNEKQKEI